jgi:hypothetical protein
VFLLLAAVMFLRQSGAKKGGEDDESGHPLMSNDGSAALANGAGNGQSDGSTTAAGRVVGSSIRRLPQEDHLIVGQGAAGQGAAGQAQVRNGALSPSQRLHNKYSGPLSTGGAAANGAGDANHASGVGVVVADGSDAGTDGEYECDDDSLARILVAGQASADFDAVTKAFGHIEAELTLWKIDDRSLMDESDLESSLTPEMATQLKDKQHYAAAVMVFDCASLAKLKHGGGEPGPEISKTDEFSIPRTDEYLLNTAQFNLGGGGGSTDFGSVDGDSWSSMAGNGTVNSIVGMLDSIQASGALVGDRGPMQALKRLLAKHFSMDWVLLVGTGCEDAVDGMDPGKPIEVRIAIYNAKGVYLLPPSPPPLPLLFSPLSLCLSLTCRVLCCRWSYTPAHSSRSSTMPRRGF